MSISRKLLRTMGLTDEQQETIIEENAKTIESIKSENDKLRDENASLRKSAEQLSVVQKELDDIKQSTADYEAIKKQYEDEKQAFEDYKKNIETENAMNKVKSAYTALLKANNVDDKRIDSILKVTDFTEKKLNKDGKFENEKDLNEAIKTEWKDFIVKTETRGAEVETPPANNGGNKLTKADIMKIKDTEKRQQAIADNPELFGIA